MAFSCVRLMQDPLLPYIFLALLMLMEVGQHRPTEGFSGFDL